MIKPEEPGMDAVVESSNSIASFIKRMQPNEVKTFHDWFKWPPDIFAITSLILDNSGWYRFVADCPFNAEKSDSGPDKINSWMNDRKWNRAIAEKAEQWSEWLKGNHRKSRAFSRGKNRLIKLLRQTDMVTLQEFDPDRVLGKPESIDTDELGRTWELIVILVEFHIMSDSMGMNMGLANENLGFASEYGLEDPSIVTDKCVRDYDANQILMTMGSLSRISKDVGIVLPKIRTPKVGFTIRSLSHHLAFVKTEVEVIWRNLPWVNTQEKGLNILVLPIPYKINADFFSSVKGARRKTPENERYFEYAPDPSKTEENRIESIVEDQIAQARQHCQKVHMLVLPELALNSDSLNRLKKHLASTMNHNEVPHIVTGVRDWNDKKSSRSAANQANPIIPLSSNTVVLSAFYAGRWYDLYQNKHHRWKLDRHQVETYKLSGVLSGSNDWWEHIRLPRRYLSFLAANSWLTLCPLICEDLARIEPVSRVIRSVGPNLVVALLLDGPQLVSRWPSRYATILADDPGSSVLTVTSLGMCERSTPENLQANRTIALWKDAFGVNKEITLDENGGGALLSVEAQFTEEFTLDGRSDKEAASVLTLRNWFQLDKPEVREKQDTQDSHKFADDILLSTHDDMRELSHMTLLVNTLLFAKDREVRDRISKINTLVGNGKKNKKNLSKLETLLMRLSSEDGMSELENDMDEAMFAYAVEQLLLIYGDDAVAEAKSAFFALQEQQREPHQYLEDKLDEARIVYLERLSRLCADHVKKINDSDPDNLRFSWHNEIGVVKKGRFSSSFLAQLPGDDGQTNGKYRPIRYFMATNLFILWSIHNYLSGDNRQKVNSPREGQLLVFIEKVITKMRTMHSFYSDY